MATNGDAIQLCTLRFLEIFLATILAVVGSVLAVITAKDAITFMSDLMWRLSKGYFKWDMQASMAAYIFSIAMLATLFFIFAHALFRSRWSRRTTFWVIGVSVIGCAAFVLAFSLLVTGFSGLKDF